MSGVAALVDETVFLAAQEQILHHLGVIGAGGALEAVDMQTQCLPLTFEFGGDDVGKFTRRFARRRGGAFDLLPMLVRAGRENHVVALHLLEASDGVGGDGGVRVANMRRCIGVVDRCREIVFHFLFFK